MTIKKNARSASNYVRDDYVNRKGLAAPHHATWSWGDGNQEPGTLIQANWTGSVSGQHTYDAPGTYTVRLTVSDSNGERTTVSRTVVVS